MNKIEISSSAVIGNVEKDFFDYFSSESFSSLLVINMKEVAFIEIATMVYLSQLIHSRDKSNFETRIILPKSDNVMISLHTWRFFGIIEELTDKNISNFIEGDFEGFREVKFEIEGKTFYKDINNDYFDKYYSDKGIQNLVRKGFFSLICLPFKTEKEKRYALKSQRLQWRTDRLIADVLERNLLNQVEVGNILANTIIYECLTNSARHPKSDHVVIGSYFDFKRSTSKKNNQFHFTIVLWDNGNSIINTLKESIHSGVNIRSTESFELAQNSGLTSWFKLKRTFPTSSKHDSLYYDFIPTKETVDEEILVSSLFPGISRDPERKQPLFVKDESMKEEDRIVNDDILESYGPGLGLTFLLDSVVGSLNGTLAIRTNEYFMNVKSGNRTILSEFKRKDGKSVDSIYQAKLIKNSNNATDFLGNMITIRIPLNYEK